MHRERSCGGRRLFQDSPAYKAVLAGSIVLPCACSSTSPVALNPSRVPAVSMQAMPVTAPKAETVTLPTYLNPKRAISTQRSVPVDENVATVRPEFAQKLELHGKFLATSSRASIRGLGHADEHGSAKHQLSLGPGESAWTLNRRVDLEYPGS